MNGKRSIFKLSILVTVSSNNNKNLSRDEIAKLRDKHFFDDLGIGCDNLQVRTEVESWKVIY